MNIKHGSNVVAEYWPEFYSKDSALFNKKSKNLPALPSSLSELTDLPNGYKTTLRNSKFLINNISELSKMAVFSSDIGLAVLANSKRWYCDGTFKSAPANFYQHFIIHGHYKSRWNIASVYGFLTSKTYEMYMGFINTLKDASDAAGLKLDPKFIMVDFERASIKAFKRQFPNAEIRGCHFHFTSAIYKHLCSIGLKSKYSEDQSFQLWVKMVMCIPFVRIDDVDDVWFELKSK